MTVGRFRRFLYVSTYAYLGLPFAIFFGGWLRQPYATIFTLALAAGLIAAGMQMHRRLRDTEEESAPVPWRLLAIGVAAMVVVASIGGAGGWGYQDLDWLKYNAILRDLVNKPWPVVYDVDGVRVMLTYYVTYLLPAALVGKVFGWQAANHTLFAFTVIGLSLSALWVWFLTRATSWWFILVFLAFSGMDVVGQAISTIYLAPSVSEGVSNLTAKWAELQHMEWWLGWSFAQLSATSTLVVWAPNHGWAAWMLTGLALTDTRANRVHTTGVLYVALCAFWAPFVTLGLMPVVGLLMLRYWRQQRFSVTVVREAISVPNVAGIMVGLMVAVYLAGRFQPYPLPFETAGMYKEHITLTFLRLPDLFMVRYSLFVALEFLILHCLLYWYLMKNPSVVSPPLRALLVLSTAGLLLLPIVNWGYNNEPAMRSSIPLLFVTILVVMHVLQAQARETTTVWLRRAIIAVLLVGSANPIVEYGRHVRQTYKRGALVAVPDQGSIRTLFELQEMRYRGRYNFVSQYVGSADSPFVRHFARQLEGAGAVTSKAASN